MGIQYQDIRVPHEQRGAVALIDALGTRRLWESPNPGLEALKWDLLVQAAEFGQVNPRTATALWRPTPNAVQSVPLPEIHLQYHVAAFSDTFILTLEGAFPPHDLVHWFGARVAELFVNGLKNGVSLRGAVALGSFFESDKAVIGKAISEAASCHEKAKWAGIVLTPESVALLEGSHTDCAFCNRLWPTYDVPVSATGAVTRTRVLAWPRFFVPFDPSMTRDNVEGWLRSRPTDDGARQKITNTLTFFDAMTRNG
ncbi:MAG: hypothetical protein JRN35_05065 [Nitrososphaerota archaeon]|jgi:hypothetical protein|nr:hypothetical protein [Nitrososphaerota archaeon]